ncbi:Unknown protein sequence [Pseudomonas syringae pv. syringae]|uniref:Uncharacterized protein n=4 Tax=Pseudomonas TaxID=286 RepID=A0A3M5WVK0_9PSED|nr:Unknown protein sequence [Pseudomonas syringae pv. syringae]KPW86770.1 hypothetical protein ALO92_101883 [Pseudomonas congelans]KPX06850.1 hypothetical protein ALO75_103160 [Pseudomonas syringae pv. coryli]KPY23460.1 hypothetical protein ALO65_102322 [Pseudomonas syringae pv. papulans]RMM40093.1 hypothetical protein ALQ78_101762 [Pseudomonas syringae pv. aptata]RMS25638.1 hypothetical protein ALP69_102245 [Pseudomonas syringae pv. aceris]RMT41942.1 hypothetical protein ALP49_102985 [Pseudo
MLFTDVCHVFILSDELMWILHACLTRAGCDPSLKGITNKSLERYR